MAGKSVKTESQHKQYRRQGEGHYCCIVERICRLRELLLDQAEVKHLSGIMDHGTTL